MTDQLIPVALVDDDQAYAEAQVALAATQGFAITWYKTWAAAKDHIRNREFELVILDAKGQLDGAGPAEDIGHLHQARTDLALWRGQNIHIPYVICTGFDEGEVRNLRDEKRYLKGNEEEMYRDIQVMVAHATEAALREEFKDVLAILREPYLDDEAEGLFLDALKYIEHGDRSGRDRLFMNPLRQVLEKLFRAAHKRGLLPDELVKPKLNQRFCAIFLKGEKVYYPSMNKARLVLSTTRPVFPKLVGQELDQALTVTNWGSHAQDQAETAEDSNYLMDNEELFQEHGGTPYLLRTVVSQVMDVLWFFKVFVDKYPNAGTNRAWMEREEFIKLPEAGGVVSAPGPVLGAMVSRGPEDAHAFAKHCYIAAALVREHDLHDGDQIDMVVNHSEKRPGTFQAVIITRKY